MSGNVILSKALPNWQKYPTSAVVLLYHHHSSLIYTNSLLTCNGIFFAGIHSVKTCRSSVANPTLATLDVILIEMSVMVNGKHEWVETLLCTPGRQNILNRALNCTADFQVWYYTLKLFGIMKFGQSKPGKKRKPASPITIKHTRMSILLPLLDVGSRI